MKQQFILTSPNLDIGLRTISETDLENLRQWKNSNRFSFFFQNIIAPEQQAQWFRGYLERVNDYMFMVACDQQSIGCMGFRFIEGVADIYNVIRGNSGIKRRGLISQGMRLMCSFILGESRADIVAQVLLTNPAIEWYEKNGFDRHAEHSNYVEMKLNRSRFDPCVIIRTDQGSNSNGSIL